MALQDDARRVKALLEKSQAILPKIMDEAIETGDFSKVERAQQMTGRLATLSQRYSDQIMSSMPQPAASGGIADEETAAPAMPGPEDEAWSPAKAEPPAWFPKAEKDLFPSEPSGQKPATYDMRGLDRLSAQAKGLKPMDAGDPNADPIVEQSKRIAAPQGLGPSRLAEVFPELASSDDFADVDLALERAKKIQQPDPLHGLRALMPQDGSEAEPVDEATAIKNRKTIEDYIAGGKKGFQVSSREENPESLPPDEQPTGLPESQPNPLDGKVDVEAVAPQIEKEYGGDASAMVGDINRLAQGGQFNETEQEFLRRVNVELGQRPKAFTITKLLAALTLGASSIVGAWLSGRYNGQALVDLSEDQKDYDQRRSRIASEVYREHGAQKRAEAAQAAMEGRLSKLEMGRDARSEARNELEREKFQAGEQGRDRRLDVQEAGKDRRLDTTEEGKGVRQERQIEAQKEIAEKRAALQQRTARWSDTDRQRVIALRQKINGLARKKNDFMTLPEQIPAIQAEIDALEREQEEIFKRNEAAGK